MSEKYTGPEMNPEKMSAEELLDLIIVVADDYDGFRKPESLMGLIDEIVDYARLAREALVSKRDA